MTIVQLVVIALALLTIAILCVWLTHEFREAERRMIERENDRRKS